MEREKEIKMGFCGTLYPWDAAAAAAKDVVVREMMVLRTEGRLMLVLTRLVVMTMLS